MDFKTVATPKKGTATGIVIRDLPKKGVYLDGSDYLRTEVTSVEQTLELLRRCAPCRSEPRTPTAMVLDPTAVCVALRCGVILTEATATEPLDARI